MRRRLTKLACSLSTFPERSLKKKTSCPMYSLSYRNVIRRPGSLARTWKDRGRMNGFSQFLSKIRCWKFISVFKKSAGQQSAPPAGNEEAEKSDKSEGK